MAAAQGLRACHLPGTCLIVGSSHAAQPSFPSTLDLPPMVNLSSLGPSFTPGLLLLLSLLLSCLLSSLASPFHLEGCWPCVSDLPPSTHLGFSPPYRRSVSPGYWICEEEPRFSGRGLFGGPVQVGGTEGQAWEVRAWLGASLGKETVPVPSNTGGAQPVTKLLPVQRSRCSLCLLGLGHLTTQAL